MPSMVPDSKSNCALKCIISRYFPIDNTEEAHQELINDIKKCFSHYGAVSIYANEDSTKKKQDHNDMQATAIVEYHHIKEFINVDDLTDTENEHCAIIHYIATNPKHLGLETNQYIKALLNKISDELQCIKPKLKTVYLVTKGTFFDTLESGNESLYESLGFKQNSYVTFDKKTAASCSFKTFNHNNVLSAKNQRKIGKYSNSVWRPEEFEYIKVFRCKVKDNGIFSYHKYLGEKNCKDYAKALRNGLIVNEINAAILALDDGHNDSEIIIQNMRGRSRSMVNKRDVSAWEASICLLERYNTEDTQQRMVQSLHFESEKYEDLRFFGSTDNTLYTKLKVFDYALKKPIYPKDHLKATQKVEKKDYKSIVMNAKEGCFVCLLTDSNNCSTQIIGIDATIRKVYHLRTCKSSMPLNEATLTKCCGGLECIAFAAVGVIYLH